MAEQGLDLPDVVAVLDRWVAKLCRLGGFGVRCSSFVLWRSAAVRPVFVVDFLWTLHDDAPDVPGDALWRFRVRLNTSYPAYAVTR